VPRIVGFELALSVASAALLCGCGGPDRVELYPVAGSLAFRGRPAAGARLVFHDDRPREELHKLPIPRATTDAQGAFRVSSYDEGDGAPAGMYHITVDLPAHAIPDGVDPEAAEEPVDQLKGRYLDPATTPLTCEVKPGDNVLPALEVK
jgi:hypothetical protein